MILLFEPRETELKMSSYSFSRECEFPSDSASSATQNEMLHNLKCFQVNQPERINLVIIGESL
jgi:hypothetical protein